MIPLCAGVAMLVAWPFNRIVEKRFLNAPQTMSWGNPERADNAERDDQTTLAFSCPNTQR
jgi:hypothetical protein